MNKWNLKKYVDELDNLSIETLDELKNELELRSYFWMICMNAPFFVLIGIVFASGSLLSSGAFISYINIVVGFIFSIISSKRLNKVKKVQLLKRYENCKDKVEKLSIEDKKKLTNVIEFVKSDPVCKIALEAIECKYDDEIGVNVESLSKKTSDTCFSSIKTNEEIPIIDGTKKLGKKMNNRHQ